MDGRILRHQRRQDQGAGPRRGRTRRTPQDCPFHEYIHSLIHSITKSCPLWIHEGLAEYFSKGPSQRVGQVIPLNYLEKSFSGLSGKGISLAYIESHSAISYLMDRYRADRMKNMLFFSPTGKTSTGHSLIHSR